MTLRAAALVPPIVLSLAPMMSTPSAVRHRRGPGEVGADVVAFDHVARRVVADEQDARSGEAVDHHSLHRAVAGAIVRPFTLGTVILDPVSWIMGVGLLGSKPGWRCRR